ncbi:MULTISPECIES: flagellin [unclassified Thioalkalivibrio]|uniref:flagellin N-terminal helical domain-containing protein n=1 Tax=unclassified Thioalkalivibrio TaxID=2621013 RepID=UPI000363B51A|nr:MULTISPECIES: flagellin [unclassified Thioalkalivibrio]
MAQVINTNLLSLNTRRNLRASQGALQVALQRLASGRRINSARDDAAGRAISERFTTQIRGLNQAMRNAQDGIALARTAEGGLGSMSGNLQRIRELALQAANGTLSASDRRALNQEARQLLAETDRVVTQTTFNGRTLLDGSASTAFFQVGANAGQTLAVDLGDGMGTRRLGAVATSRSGDLTALFANGPFTVAGDFRIRIGDAPEIDVPDGNYDSVAALATAINRELESPARASATLDGRLDITARETITISGTAGLATLGLPATAAVEGNLAGIDLGTAQGASDALARLDQALDRISARRSRLGAVQNRLEATIDNLGIGSENLQAARSRILDTDYAAEVAALIRAQILQQAGIANLAQANLAPRLVLRLLG